MALQAVLFDLDGVLIDSEQLGLEIAKKVLEEEGLSISADDLRDFVGVPDRDFYRRVAAAHPSRDFEGLLTRHTELYEAELHKVSEVEGAVELINRFKGVVPLGLVSGSTRRQINQVLNRLNLLDVFKVVVSADDVPCGKPDPHCYRLAARQLGVQEVGCVAIEDSDSGIRAAKGAGMWAVAYRPYCPEDAREIADAVVKRLTDVTVPMLQDVVLGLESESLLINLEAPGWRTSAAELGTYLHRSEYLKNSDPFDPWSLLRKPEDDFAHRLFCFGQAVSENEVRSRLGRDLTRGLLDIGLLRQSDDGVSATGCVLGAFGQLLFIDRPRYTRRGAWHSAHTYLDDSSVWYVCAVRQLCKQLVGISALEIGSGSGIASLLLAHAGVKEILALDIDYASVALSRFNAAMNGVEGSVRVERSDMFQYLVGSGREFSLVLFHPPYRIVPPDINYPNPTQRIGAGKDGLEMVRKFIRGVREYLADGGRAALAVQLPQYHDHDAAEELSLLAHDNGLALNAVAAGVELGLEDIASGIALKEEATRDAEIKEKVTNFYRDLGIMCFTPLLLVLTTEGAL
jgi:HAD superfamily hydrolase (TIGR01549 family)